MSQRAYAILVILLLSQWPSTISAAERVALVIGNSSYSEGAALRNPANDADAIASALEELGFKVFKKKDLGGVDEMRDALAEFHRTLEKGSLGLFYYAGHGVQVKGENFLVPVQAKLREEYEVPRQCLEVGEVLAAMESADINLKVVVLDCCRNNPFARSWRTRSTSIGGLAAISDFPEGTIVAFSTAPGKTAADGGSTNSPYTEQLVASLRARPDNGLELGELFREASRAVKRATRQVPWISGEGSLELYFLWKPGMNQPQVVAKSESSNAKVIKESGLQTSHSFIVAIRNATDQPVDFTIEATTTEQEIAATASPYLYDEQTVITDGNKLRNREKLQPAEQRIYYFTENLDFRPAISVKQSSGDVQPYTLEINEEYCFQNVGGKNQILKDYLFPSREIDGLTLSDLEEVCIFFKEDRTVEQIVQNKSKFGHIFP